MSFINDAGIFDRNIQNENSTRNEKRLKDLQAIVDDLNIKLNDSKSTIGTLNDHLNNETDQHSRSTKEVNRLNIQLETQKSQQKEIDCLKIQLNKSKEDLKALTEQHEKSFKICTE